MSYQPNKAIHPGATVARTLAGLGMTQKSLSARTSITEKHISSIINGEASITPETAALFSNAIGGSASFWNNLQKNYEEAKVRIENEKRAAGEVDLVAAFPYGDLVKLSKVSPTRDKVEKVVNLWQFFGVNSLQMVQQTEAVAYRRGYGKGVKQEALATWLRCGELDSAKISLNDFDESGLKSLLPKIREMTQMLEQNFFQQLQTTLAGVGVGLVGAPHLAGTQAHGATRWIGNNPIIQLSIRRKNADTFWFTFFHEVGHIFLHGKKDQFISFDTDNKTHEETEADIFAARILIPDDAYRIFLTNRDFSEQAIKSFAQHEKINPGIVVGRLKNDGYLPYSHHQHLHTKLIVARDDN